MAGRSLPGKWSLGRAANQPLTDGPATTGSAMRTLRGACDELRVAAFATVGMERSSEPWAPRPEHAHGGREVDAAADTVLLVHPRRIEERSITMTLVKHPRGRSGTLKLTAA